MAYTFWWSLNQSLIQTRGVKIHSITWKILITQLLLKGFREIRLRTIIWIKWWVIHAITSAVAHNISIIIYLLIYLFIYLASPDDDPHKEKNKEGINSNVETIEMDL